MRPIESSKRCRLNALGRIRASASSLRAWCKLPNGIDHSAYISFYHDTTFDIGSYFWSSDPIDSFYSLRSLVNRAMLTKFQELFPFSWIFHDGLLRGWPSSVFLLCRQFTWIRIDRTSGSREILDGWDDFRYDCSSLILYQTQPQSKSDIERSDCAECSCTCDGRRWNYSLNDLVDR